MKNGNDNDGVGICTSSLLAVSGDGARAHPAGTCKL